MSSTGLAPRVVAGTMASRTIFVDADPLAERRLTGIGRYTARLALALAHERREPVRFFSRDREVLAPGGLDWSRTRDLARWARRRLARATDPAGRRDDSR